MSVACIRSSGDPRKAFTLIELLVVVSIIVLLIAILLPSLGKARRSASAVVCLSNLKQLGQASTIYANEYQGSLPMWGFAGTLPGGGSNGFVWNQHAWPATLAPILGQNPYVEAKPPRVYFCKDAEINPEAWWQAAYPISYSISWFSSTCHPSVPGWRNYEYLKISRPVAADFPLFADSTSMLGFPWYIDGFGGEWKMLATRHGGNNVYNDRQGKANVVFLDAHAEPLLYDDFAKVHPSPGNRDKLGF